ncbi:alkaline phosphatase [Escherichia coli]|nr:alkaline phosphatase [Escherichia coli]SQY98406.1 alkaline phosphatase [Escherichia coli]
MKQSTIALALLSLLFTPVTKARTPEMPVLENRAAQGDITAPGGARRLTGDQTAALRDSLREGANKQVISSQADSLIKISRIWADFFPANTSNQPI